MSYKGFIRQEVIVEQKWWTNKPLATDIFKYI